MVLLEAVRPFQSNEMTFNFTFFQQIALLFEGFHFYLLQKKKVKYEFSCIATVAVVVVVVVGRRGNDQIRLGLECR
jgi:hypothetical protein